MSSSACRHADGQTARVDEIDADPSQGQRQWFRGRTGGICRPQHVDLVELALSVAGDALLGLGNLLRNQPDRDDAAAADTVTEDVLRPFGLPADEARENLPPTPA
jgi:hypothetical protein